MRVRVCARERAVIGIFTFHISHFTFHISLFPFPHPLFSLSTSPKNDLSFYEKQAVVLKKTTRRFMKNKPSLYTKVSIGENKGRNPAHTTCINMSIKRISHAQKPRRWAENKRRDIEKQRKSNEDIAKQKRHLPPICLKKVY